MAFCLLIYTRAESVPGKHALLRAVMVSLRPAMLAPIIPRLFQTFFTFMQPLLLTRSIKYAETAVPDPNAGYALIGAYALVYVGYAVREIFAASHD